MKSTEILCALNEISADPGKTNKVAMVARYGVNEEFKRVLIAALNPFKTYGIAAIPERSSDAEGVAEFSDGTWYLIERLEKRTLTGNAARNAVAGAIDSLNPDSSQLLKRILTKDLRAGFGDSTVNKAIPRLIPEFAYMRCSLPPSVDFSTWPWEKGVFSQLKADGMFANVNVESSGSAVDADAGASPVISITSRQGSPMPLEPLASLVAAMQQSLSPGYQYHGELLVQQQDTDTGLWVILPREKGNGRLNSVLKGGVMPEGFRAVYQVWDRVPLSAIAPKGKHLESYKQRFTDLQDMLANVDGHVMTIPCRVVFSLEDAHVHYREMLANGYEGTVLKHPGAIWRDGDSPDQIKLKLCVDVELEIVGFNPGEGKNAATFGSILCKSRCGKLEVSVSGFSDAVRAELWARRDELVGAVMTVKSNGIMYSSKEGGLHSLFLPRFVEIRADKDVADSFDRIIEQFNAAVSSKPEAKPAKRKPASFA